MTNKEFEEMMKRNMIGAYIKVMGKEKWESFTNEEKDALLHIMVKGFVKPMIEAL